MPYISTEDLKPSLMTNEVQQQAYNGLDCCVTFEVHNELNRIFNQEPEIYSFEKALQGPYLEIMQRGILVDQTSRQSAARELRSRIEYLQDLLNELATPVWGKGLNPRSPPQLKSFFYTWLALPEQWISQKGERKLSTNREVLEKLEQYMYARPIIACILLIRDCSKQLQTFEIEIDSDGRFRTSYNIAGTESGRPSSSSNAFGTGGNAQNIAPSLRYPFIADKGYKLACIDLEQVEARDVGWFEGVLFGDWTFLNACESGDLHTNNSKLVWPELKWTGDPGLDRKIAEGQFYREFSYRDMSKRGGHLCLTEEHEVLTPTGWKPISTKPTNIMVWSPEKSYFSETAGYVDEEYSGELHEWVGNSMSVKMTPNHKIPYITDQRKPVYKTKTAKEGPGQYMPLGNGFVGGDQEVPARLIAAFMSDGHQKSTNRMEFHLRKPRKIERLKTLCQMYGFFLEQMSHDKYNVHGNLPKRTGPFMFNWTKDSLRDFLDEYKFWDGHQSETAVSLFSVDKVHLEWIQTFGRLLGIGGALRHSVTRTNFGGEKEYVTDYYTLQQNHRQFATGSALGVYTTTTAGCRVYCPTTVTGFFYVRRNGRIFVTGNSNYMGTAWTMSRHLKIPLKVAEEFQARYCKGPTCAFPAHQKYWQWIAEELQTTNKLTTPFGRVRHFFGRPGDDTTLREAIAFLPQSTTADRMNLGLWKVWKNMPEVQLLGQGFDSITFQYRGLDEDIIPRALELIRVTLTDPISGRKYTVPGEAKVGFNWGSQVTQQDVDKARTEGRKVPRLNPDGLIKWKSGKPDLRERQTGFNRLIGT